MGEACKILEDAAVKTLGVLNEKENQYPIENVKFAIANAIVNGNYDGFTRVDGARESVSRLRRDEVLYALFRNMINLSNYKNANGCELGANMDFSMFMCLQSMRDDNIDNLIAQICNGMWCIVQDRNFSFDISYRNPMSNQYKRLAKGLLDGFVFYNCSLHLVDSNYDSSMDSHLEKLDKYYRVPSTVVK